MLSLTCYKHMNTLTHNATSQQHPSYKKLCSTGHASMTTLLVFVCVCLCLRVCTYMWTHTHTQTHMSPLICVYMCECRWVVFGTEKSFSALLVCERSCGCVCSMFGLHPVHTCVYYLFIHFYDGMCVCLCVCVCVSMCVFV